MTRLIHAKATIDIELHLTGTYQAGYKGDRIDPPEDPSIEDPDIESVTFERVTTKWAPDVSMRETTRAKFDLLKGLDKAARDILTANLIEAVGEENLASVLMDQAVEYAR